MNYTDVLYTVFWVTVYLIISVIFLSLLFKFIAAFFRAQREKKDQYSLTFLQIKLPQKNEVEIEAAEQMFAGLLGIRKSFLSALFTGQHRISFEIVSKAEGIGFYVVVPDDMATLVEKQINGAYPEAEIDIIDPNEIWDRGAYTSTMELKLTGPPYFPIKTYEDLGSNDSMNAITSSMSKLGTKDALAIQYVIRPAGNSWRNAGQRFIDGIKAKSSDPNSKMNVDPAFTEGVQGKIGKGGFDISIRMVSLAEDKMSAESHLKNVAASFEQFANVTYSKFKRRKFRSQKKIINDFIYRRLHVKDWYIPIFDVSLRKNTSVLNVEEMATVFHFPNKNVQTPKIIWLSSRKSAAPVNLPTEGELYFGHSVFRGAKAKVLQNEEDRRRHTYIIGQTGTGKSELLMYLAQQDIKNGKGVCVIDPHGTDIDKILETVPPERADDVILFDVSDTEKPLGLNILEAETDEQRNMVINAFIALLYKLYDPNRTGIIGPKLERAVRNVMLTAMVDPESTLVDVLLLLTNTEYAQKFIPKIKDPLVKRYWTDEVAQTSDFHKSETMGYFASKFDKFVGDKTIRNIIGQPKSSLDFSEIMGKKKILLVDLSKGKIGEENSNFLGLILVPKILSAAMGRHKLIGKEEFPDFYLYVDEFQNFATPDFATILSEARKYKLNLIVANQFISQLSDEIKSAVFGNVGTTIAFRVGADDADYLETQFEPFEKNDLMNNAVGNYYMKLLVEGHPTPPFSVNLTWDEIQEVERDPAVAKKIKEVSREKYGKPASEVEKYIDTRAGFNEEPKAAEAIRDLF